MTENFDTTNPRNFPGKKHEIDQDPILPDENEVIVPGDPLEHDSGRDEADQFGDDPGDLGDASEKPHITKTPSATFDDGIRDGDRDAYDEIPYDEEDDFPRQTP